MRRFLCGILILALLLCACSPAPSQESAKPQEFVASDEKEKPQKEILQEAEEDSKREEPAEKEEDQKKDPIKVENSQKEEPSKEEKTEEEQKKPVLPAEGENRDAGVPEDAYAWNYQGPKDREFRAAVYEGVVYYECDPYAREPWQPHVYSFPLDKTGEPKDLIKGEMIGLYGSALIVKSEGQVCVKDLSKEGSNWIAAGKAERVGAAVEVEQKVLFWSALGGKYYADTLDLKDLTVKREESAHLPLQCHKVGETLFYLVAQKQQTHFYRSGTDGKAGQKIIILEGEWNLYETKGELFLFSKDAKSLPLQYDHSKGTVSPLPNQYASEIDFIYLHGVSNGVAYMDYYRLIQGHKFNCEWQYDLVQKKELPVNESLDMYTLVLPNGFCILDKDSTKVQVKIGNLTRSIKLKEDTQQESVVVLIDRDYVVLLNYQMISTGSFSTKKTKLYFHTWQEVTKE